MNVSKNRNLILSSAKELFASRGFDEVTIKEICAHAGVANSTFYYHFKTKEELLHGLRAQDELPIRSELLNIMRTPNLLEQVIAVCMIRVSRAEHHGHTITAQYYKAIIGKETDGDDLEEEHAQEDQMISVLIRRAQQEGVIRSDIATDALVDAAIRLTRGVIMDWCAAGGSMNMRGEVRRMLLTLFGVKGSE